MIQHTDILDMVCNEVQIRLSSPVGTGEALPLLHSFIKWNQSQLMEPSRGSRRH